MTDTSFTRRKKPLTGTDTVTWAAMAASVNGQAWECSNYPDKTVQCFGTFGGTVTMQGSNDPRVITDAANAVWFSLTDKYGNAITFTAAGAKLITENPRFIRPSNGSGITATTVIIQAAEE